MPESCRFPALFRSTTHYRATLQPFEIHFISGSTCGCRRECFLNRDCTGLLQGSKPCLHPFHTLFTPVLSTLVVEDQILYDFVRPCTKALVMMPLEINNETYCTVNEACDFLAITRDTLYRRIWEGRLQKYTHGATNRVYFRLTDLNAL